MSDLIVRNLSHQFDGYPVVREVSLAVGPGEVVCLLGPSGCGKTTLLRVAAGLEKLQQGQVLIDGIVVADADRGLSLPPEKRGIGLMFQDYALFPHLTVRENIQFGVGATTAERRAWIDSALEMMDLTGYAGSFPHTLSGGQQQRVALLRALAPNPRALFLDEPFSGLDVTRRAQVRQQTLKVLKNAGVATLMVTHDPEEAMFMADRILVMNMGRVVQDGTPVETYFEPADAFVAGFFGPINRLAGRVGNGTVETPLGTFSAERFIDGTHVDVLIRPEGLRLIASEDRSETRLFEVISARPLGAASVVNVSVPQPNGANLSVEARVPGVFLPAPGSRVSVSVNEGDVHLFEND